MRGWIRLIEVTGLALLLVVLAVVGSRVSADGAPGSASGSSNRAATNLVSLVDRLRAAGLTVTIGGEVHQTLLSVPGRTLIVAGEDVEVFAYADAASAAAEASRLHPAGGTGSAISDWIDAPHLFRNDRLLVLHIGGSSRLDSALSGVLGPQFSGLH